MNPPGEAEARSSGRKRELPGAPDSEVETVTWQVAAFGPALTGIDPDDVLAGRYRIDGFLARGGMGEVYRAFDLMLGIPVAMKTIRPEIASDPCTLRLFKQEVLMARSVSHPNVCRIYDLGLDERKGVSFLTMEYLPGETLSARIRSGGPMAPETALPIVRQLAEALDAAHGAGIVHRDFKSANVILVPVECGVRTVITDFGLAVAEDLRAPHAPRSPMAAGDGDDLGGAGDSPGPEASSPNSAAMETAKVEPPGMWAPSIHALVGTPAYMSPEQVMGGRVGPATDLYALGVVLFEMTTGRLPFDGLTPLEVASARLTTEPPAPSSLGAVDAEWERTILKLLSKRPKDRYSSGRDVVLALEGRYTGVRRPNHSLPAERDAFVGRISELALLAEQLESRPTDQEKPGPDPVPADPAPPTYSRLLTVLGAGGTGKTRLAQRYGWQSLPRWPGGAWFCDLSDARTVDGTVSAVASGLDVSLGKDDPLVQLGHAIAGRGRALVILDNFEQVAEHAPATLGKWLQRSPETSFLVTSRERLGLEGENVLALKPLDPVTHGVALFEVRAESSRPGFRVDEANRAVVVEIVRKLDGFPLAIELAAARLRMLSLNQLKARLADRFQVLAGGKRGRHSTLQAALDWSWELLAPWEQSAVAQASVFEGGFTLEAAETVIDLSGYTEALSALDAIQSLVDKSWLRAPIISHSPRFEMYATVQEYASGKLQAARVSSASGTEHTPAMFIEERHGRYFAAMGTVEAIEALDRHGGVEKRAALRLELKNLVLACQRATAGAHEEIVTATYAAAAAVLALRGPLSLSLALGGQALTVLHNRSLRGRVVGVLAEHEQMAGKPLDARDHFEEARAIARDAGDQRGEGVVLGNLGNLHSEQGRMEEARAHYEQALAIHRELGDRQLEGSALRNLGILNLVQGRTEEARAHFEQALAIHRDVGNRRAEGVVLSNLGNLHREQGRMDEARAHYEQALTALSEVGNSRFEGIVLGNLGILHLEQGRTEEARANYEQALAIHREVGNRRSEGVVLGNLGNLHHEQGRVEAARAHYEQALAIGRELDDRRSESIVLDNLGVLHLKHGRTEEARTHYERALIIHRELNDRRLEGLALINLGGLHLDQGRMEEARAHYEQALALAREVDDQRCEGVVLGSLSMLHQKLGEMEKVQPCLDEGIAILRKVGDRQELAKMLCARGEYELQCHGINAARAALAEAEEISQSLAVASDSELARALTGLREALRSHGA